MIKKTKQQKAKEPIKVREKVLANGNKSLYLDYYSNGKREYEFLKLYIVPEWSAADKAANLETWRLANAVKAQKIVELQNAAHGFSITVGRSRANVLTYIQSVADKKKAKAGGAERGTYQGYVVLMYHIKQYSGDKTTFKQIDKKYCEGFIEYLKTAQSKNYLYSNPTLNESTQFLYMKQFGTVLNSAIVDGLTTLNPFKQIPQENKPKKRHSDVCFLTIDEVNKLVATPTMPIVKNAFLFSCFSGLRFSDVKGLTWGKLQSDNEGKTYINYIQKKTKKQEYLPLAQKAIQYLPPRPDKASDNDFVFNMPSGQYANNTLKAWAAAAGIDKKVTFHVARHTNATMLLSLDVPIETVSKILGHSEIKTTQIYAKVIDKNKRAAVDKLDTV
jgi:integrase